MRIVIVGATSAIAEHCVRLWAQASPAIITLVGRSPERMQRIAADLRVRAPQSDVRALVSGFVLVGDIASIVDNIVSEGDPDIVLIAHGLLPDQERCQNNLQSCSEALEVNGLSPVLFAEAFVRHMAGVNRGTLALVGSVAGDRGRKSNYVYGAAKGLVARYVQGLQHRFAGTGVKIVLIKPGPTDTPMTAHLKVRGAKLASVEEVAAQIVKAIERAVPVAYVPGKWRFIMWVIRHLPAAVFNRLNI